MRIILLTNEYPPHIYGGAGVHVEYLSQELARLEEGRHAIQVLCFGEQRVQSANLTVEGVQPARDALSPALRHPRLLDTLFGTSS